jgi:hypothetical protein
MNRYKPHGWRNESYRHSLSARGIKTSLAAKEYNIKEIDKDYNNATVEGGGYKWKLKRTSLAVSDKEALNDVKRVAVEIGDIPTRKEYAELGKYDPLTVITKSHSGDEKWSSALSAAGLTSNKRLDRDYNEVLREEKIRKLPFAAKFKVGDSVRIKDGAKALEEKSFYELGPEERKHVVNNFFEGKYSNDQEKEIAKKINNFYGEKE